MAGEKWLLASSALPPTPDGKDYARSDDKANENTQEESDDIKYTINETLQTLSRVRHRFDNCGDVRYPSIIVTTKSIKKTFLDIKNKGIKTRLITEITKDNLFYCKKLMQVVSEVRHLDGVKGIFALTDTEYVSYTISQKARLASLTQLVTSTSKEFVNQQHHFFDILWDKAIPAERKIMEMEFGIMLPERTEIITGAENILRLTLSSFPHIRES